MSLEVNSLKSVQKTRIIPVGRTGVLSDFLMPSKHLFYDYT